jgi:hypothetical protein
LCVDDVKAEIAKKKAEASKGKPTQNFLRNNFCVRK